MFSYKLRNDVHLEKKNHGCYLFSNLSERYVYWKTEGPEELINVLKGRWLNEDDMAVLFSPFPETPDWANFFYFFGKLISNSFLMTRFTQKGEPVFSVTPAPQKSVYQSSLINPEKNYRLSRFALIRQDDGAMVLESALTHYRFIIHKKELSELLFRLCHGMVFEASKDEFNTLLAALYSTGIIEAKNGDEKDQQDPLDVWEFHDLLFYSRSQKGRHLLPVGGTYRFAGKRNSPPVVKQIVSDKKILLSRPDGGLADKMVKPFKKILENRRSKRKYTKEPFYLNELSAFLFYSSRVQGLVHDNEHEDIVSLRPSPSGGARHAFEIYPFVRNCENCEPGVYRYCPQEHALEKIKSQDKTVQQLLDWNPHKVISTIPPHITLYISARFERMSWKYESIAYKLIQQDLGCLYQTFYLVAEALELGPCALGDVDSVMLGQILKIDWQTEPFIGGFTLGKCDE
jgi:SagB-type dehydrogenase family enzyme